MDYRALLSIAAQLPSRVSHRELGDQDAMEQRFFALQTHLGDVLGMLSEDVEFCPNGDPASQDELLAWLWFVEPWRRDDILRFAGEDLCSAVREVDE